MRAGSFSAGTFRGQILRAFGAGVSMRILAVLSGLLSSIALARVLGPETYGTYAFVLSLIALLALPAQMGLPALITRETARAAASMEWGLLRGIWSWSTKLILIMGAIIISAVTLGLVAFPAILSPERYEALLWGVWLVPLLALAAAREAALRGLKAVFLSGFPDQILRPLVLAVLVLGASMLAVEPLSARTTLQLALVAALLAFLLGTILLWREWPGVGRGKSAVVLKQSQWLRAILPFSLIAGMQMIRENSDILMLGYWYEDSDVGLYRIALSIRTLVVFGLMALYLGAQPYIVAAFSANSRERLQSIVRIAATLALLSALVVVLVIWLEGDSIIQLLYGSAYGAAYAPLLILSMGSLIHATFGLGGGVLSMTGYEKHVLRASVISVVLNVIGNALLIPPYGIEGAAIATTSSLAVGEIIKYLSARRILGVDGSVFAWLGVAGAGGAGK